jgi:putative endonuclease
MSYFVYLLECSDGTYYTGIAKDVAKRLHEHNGSAKGARYTRGRRPARLVYAEPAVNRSCAQAREATIRRLSKGQKTDLASHWKSQVM